MNIFKKLLKLSQNPSAKEGSDNDYGRSKYMPEEENLPVDERFIDNFTKQGGRFLYCLNEEEVAENLNNILVELHLKGATVFCPEKEVQKRVENFDIQLDKSNVNQKLLIANCEYVIADSGAILFSSNQVKQYKTFELPSTYIILAKSSQIVESIGEGLRGIKVKNQSNIPTNITTLKHFSQHTAKDNKDLMDYGASHKTVYLLLLEDL